MASSRATKSAIRVKTCIKCSNTKTCNNFSRHAGFLDGFRSTCKTCYNAQQKSDPYRFFAKIYATQKVNSTKRGHPPPDYTLQELIQWADAQPVLIKLWQDYQTAGHLKDLAPSIDRKDSSLPYTLNNLELVTWEENSKRGCSDTKLGIKLTQHKKIAAINTDGTTHKVFPSLHAAARYVEGTPTNLQRVADGTVVRKSNGRTTVLRKSKGYIWKWVT